MEGPTDVDSSMVSDISDLTSFMGDGNPILANSSNLSVFFKDCAHHCELAKQKTFEL
jgi:pyruvate-formate lyase-activating enzyme